MIVSFSLWLLAFGPPAPAASSAVEEARACEERGEEEGSLPFGCLRVIERRGGEARSAVLNFIRERAAHHEDDPRWQYHHGRALMATWDEAAETELLEAARRMKEAGDVEGELHARLALSRWFSSWSKPKESREHGDRAFRLAEASGNGLWRALARIEEAIRASRDGFGDIGLARRQLLEALELLPPDASPHVRAHVHSTLAAIARTHSDFQGGRLHAERAAALYRDAGDARNHAFAHWDVLQSERDLYDTAFVWPDDALRRRFQEGLELAQEAGHEYVASLIQCALGEMTPDPEQRLALLEACVSSREEVGYATETPKLLLAWNLAQSSDPAERERGHRMLDAVLETEVAAAYPWLEAAALDTRAGLRWHEGDRDAALEDWERHFAVIESIRDRQPDAEAKDAVFTWWVADYVRVSGLVLAQEKRTEEDLRYAFDVAERMRAAQLLDAMDSSGVTAKRAGRGETASERARVQEEAAKIAGALAEAGSDAERDEALARLEKLDADERRLRAELAQQDAAFARMQQRETVTPEDLGALLGPERAMLLYQVSLNEGPRGRKWGGSWVFLVLEDRFEVFRLPSEEKLVPLARRYLADLAANDERARHSARALFDAALLPVLESVPDEVKELVVVPDNVFHAVPFSALPFRDRPLADSFVLTRAPSATSWRSSASGDASLSGPLLAFADPASLPAHADELPTPLPGARREAELAAQLFGKGGRAEVGAAATESAVRGAPLEEVSILHFGAHALIDERDPAKSAILLGPDEEHDGALELADLADLDLEGRIVVLASCTGAGGRILGGEGPLGPARAAYVGGARAVVASLWALRDDEAHDFFSRFYGHLASGERLDRALATTKRELIESGAPARAWAGIVVFGDGGVRWNGASDPSASESVSSAPAGPPSPRATWRGGLAGLLGAFAALALGLGIRARKGD